MSEAIENIPAGWRAREIYTILNNDEFKERFELAEPGRVVLRGASETRPLMLEAAHGPKAHWDTVYTTNAPDTVSWFQAEPTVSLRLLDQAGLSPAT